ncbi:unnamed protein product [Spirodela intermedia]|uniref:Uncharacterized protein n=1 Tax=Spirodela intermedia TaxID=51605 RepID=A0A7I8IBN2_SPIIN|nr:unnamed protein product [Spirodela intermedia]CAA6654998.1 unnamed protein product [Spirodela intermedia]
MVLQRRLDYGFNGYQVPFLPRGPRSARGKRHTCEKAAEDQMCPFELLASVAGKLLVEENSPEPSNERKGDSKHAFTKYNVKEEELDEVKASNVGVYDQGSYNDGTLASEVGFRGQTQIVTVKECSQASSSASLGHSSIIIKRDPSVDVASVEESLVNGSKDEFERQSTVTAGSRHSKVEDGIPSSLRFECRQNKMGAHGNVSDACLEDLMNVDTKAPLLSSESSADEPLHGDGIPHSTSFPKCLNDLGLSVDRDDDEKSSGCTQPCNTPSKPARPPRTGDRQKLQSFSSKFWKFGRTEPKDEDFCNTELKPVFRSRKMVYTRQRTQRCTFKRRKLFERVPVSMSDGTLTTEENGASSSLTGLKTAYESEVFQVKLGIKSFKVPELLIKMPETATVGSLKRTVVEAVTAILCGGFRVGVQLQGKKLRDDSKSLTQAGISHGGGLDNLSFTLEPKAPQTRKQLTANKVTTCFLPACDGSDPPTRFPAALSLDDAAFADSCTVPLPSESLPCTVWRATMTLLPHLPTPCRQKTPRLQSSGHRPGHGDRSPGRRSVSPAQRDCPRRIRRPFSVSEVEALVQAVEDLGTGRWRDVKLCAFENAKHRTYVDLKDKWKTLVHTAKISPQQRRGEPVPQELLDRVLAVNAFWSQHQAKLHHPKHPPPPEAPPPPPSLLA